MPPRFAFWTIILDGQPTAFRARDRETLLPTLKQLQSTNPDAVMKWFARGRVWESPEDARHQRSIAAQRQRGRERRGPEWRPGGQHVDPRRPPGVRSGEPRGSSRAGGPSPPTANRREWRKPRASAGRARAGRPGAHPRKKPPRSG